jgi:hypothetical protein
MTVAAKNATKSEHCGILGTVSTCHWRHDHGASEGITMDFITNLPESTEPGRTRIPIIVDRRRKMAISLRCYKVIDSAYLARHTFEHVICNCGVLDNIVTDCGTQFIIQLYTSVCCHVSTDHRLSTAFHTQMGRLTEHQGQTTE